MSLIVQKYGGTSIGTTDRIMSVAQKIIQQRRDGYRVVVVVSAMSGETDRLMQLAQAVQSSPNPREMDVLLATGEQTTIALLCMALHQQGCPACSFTGSQAGILTDDVHNKARIKQIDTQRIQRSLSKGQVVVVAGFQGINVSQDVTTLGRGGSDTTAVALAAALQAEECQIYTDVDGVYTTDPRVVADARRLKRVTYEEMLEMASLGAKVLQIRSVEFASKYNVPLRVMSSFTEGEGTLITAEEKKMEQALISGVAFNRDEAQVTMIGVPDQPGVAHRILGPIGKANVEVDMIIQNVGADGLTDFTFTVHRNDYDKAMDLLKTIRVELGAREVKGDTKVVKVSLVGVGMRSHAGIASTMFEALSKEGINIRMISTSEIKISVVIDEKYLELGVRALHDAFKLNQEEN